MKPSLERFNTNNGSLLYLYVFCINPVILESRLIELFDKTFQRCDVCKLYGTGYFRGDVHAMMTCILHELDFTRGPL
jgi:hypothetical protein